ncbi:hypothetical protein HPB50_001098 [Hyalomma asiaticum]|uniref:Uncharacterized protein n=1 Tax=Hyalomma asiaticum TaxID=266040 RepID=A0ACB7TGN8_HYAAI|nr:hypothetical protein HPB50_001098 [Hyalomma asiaticum]
MFMRPVELRRPECLIMSGIVLLGSSCCCLSLWSAFRVRCKFAAARGKTTWGPLHHQPFSSCPAVDSTGPSRIFRGAEELLRLACGTSPKMNVADSFGLSSATAQIRNVCVQPRRRGGVGKNARSRA